MRYFSILFLLFLPYSARAQTGLVPCNGTKESPCDFNALLMLVNNLLDFAILIAMPIAAIMFAWAGFRYLTAGGDTWRIQETHEIFKKVGIGLLVVLSAVLIVKTILVALGNPDVIPFFIGFSENRMS